MWFGLANIQIPIYDFRIKKRENDCADNSKKTGIFIVLNFETINKNYITKEMDSYSIFTF